MIGFAMCGSFCTHAAALHELEELVKNREEVVPILSECAYQTDTRFGKAEDLIGTCEAIARKPVLHNITACEPLGTRNPMEVLIICPCTGNTLAKIANGITDGAVPMAAKAHLRCNRPLLIALATNDALSANLSNIAKLLNRKNVYFLPMEQDDPIGKPHSLVADFSRLGEALAAARNGVQLRRLFF